MAIEDRKILKKKQFLYADALLNLSMLEGGLQEALHVRSDFEQINRAILTNIEYMSALNASDYGQIIDNISDEEMKKIVNTMYDGVCSSMMQILEVVTCNRDIGLLIGIGDTYEWLLEHWLGTVVVDVTTAVELDDNLRDLITKKATNDLDKNVVLHEHIDKSIIGGVILQARHKRIDASIKSQLGKMKHALLTSHNDI